MIVSLFVFVSPTYTLPSFTPSVVLFALNVNLTCVLSDGSSPSSGFTTIFPEYFASNSIVLFSTAFPVSVVDTSGDHFEKTTFKLTSIASGSVTAPIAALTSSSVQAVPAFTSITLCLSVSFPFVKVPETAATLLVWSAFWSALNINLAYPSGTLPGLLGSCGVMTFGWLVNVIVPPFLMSYSFSTLYSTAFSPVPNVNLFFAVSFSTVSVGLLPG